MTLHIISNPSAAKECLNIIADNDVLVVSGEQCMESTPLHALLEKHKLATYWLVEKADNSSAHSGRNEIDYNTFVRLCTENNPIQTWH